MSEQVGKRSLLWNVLQPGDPYDIKKSLIANIPGDQKPFMGDNIEMICLFQAAEIERLTEYLNDYRLKYREIERVQLDRHAYEVLIKQLTEKSYDSESLKLEIKKLKDFIARLSEELEMERKQNKTFDPSLQGKYDEALSRMQVIINQGQELKSNINRLEIQLKSWKSRFEALDKTRMKELEERKGETQRQFNLDKQLKDLTTKFVYQRSQYEAKINKLKEEIQSKNMEINDLQSQLSEYNRSAFLHQKQLKDQLDREGKFKDQIDYLNTQLMTKSVQLQNMTVKYSSIFNQTSHRDRESQRLTQQIRQSEDEISRLNISLGQLQSRLNEKAGSDSKLEKAEDQIAMLSQQINRLEYLNSNKAKQVQQWSDKHKKLGFQYESLRREYNDVNGRLGDLETSYRNLSDLQNTLIKMTQQNTNLKNTIRYHEQTINRLNFDLGKIEPELLEARKQLSIFAEENSKFRSKVNELTIFIEASSKNKNLIADLETRIRMLENERDHAVRQSQDLSKSIIELKNELTFARESISTEYQGRINDLQNALNKEKNKNSIDLSEYQRRMRDLTESHEERIRLMTRELEMSKRSTNIEEHQYELAKNRIRQLSLEVQNWGQRYNNLLEEKDKLNEIAHELQHRLKSLGGEERIVRFNEEIEKLNRKLREKNEQLIILETEIKELELYRIKYNESMREIDTLRNRLQLLEPVHNKEHEIKVISLNKQIEALKKQTVKIIQYENRISVFSEEIDRLKTILNAKIVEYNNLQLEFNRVNSEREDLNIIAHDLQERLRLVAGDKSQITMLTTANQQYETRIILLSQELERLLSKIGLAEGENRNLNLEIDQMRKSVRNNTSVQAEYERKHNILQQQISRLNTVLKSKIDQCTRLESEVRQISIRESERVRSQYESNVLNLRNATDENKRLSESIKTLQIQYKELEDEFRSSTVGLHTLKNENDTLKRRIHELQIVSRSVQELQIEISQLKRQLEQRNNELANLNDRLRILTSEHQKSLVQLRSRESSSVEITRITSQFNQRITVINQENSRLKSQYEEGIRKISQLEEIRQKLINENQLFSVQMKERYLFEDKLREERGEFTKKNSILVEEIEGYKNRIDLLIKEADNYKLQYLKLEKTKQEQEQNESLHQHKLIETGNEIERLNKILRSKIEIIEEANRKSVILSSDYNLVKKENEDLKKQAYELNSRLEIQIANNKQYNLQVITELNRKISNYEQQVALLSQQIDRLKQMNTIERQKGDRTASQLKDSLINKDILESRLMASANEIEIFKKNQEGYDDKIQLYLRQLERLNNALQIKVRESEQMQMNYDPESDSKMANYINEIERLNNILKLKVIESEDFREKHNGLAREVDNMRERYNQVVRQNDRQKKDITIFQEEVRSYKIQISNVSLQSAQIERLKRSQQDYESKIQIYLKEMQRLNNILQIKMNECEQLQSKYDSEKDSKMVNYINEIERLNNILKLKVIESDDLRERHNQVVRQYEVSKKKFFEMQQKFSKLNVEFEGLSRLISSQQQEIKKYQQQNYNLKVQLNNGSLQSVEEKNRVLAEEIQRLNKINDELRIELAEIRLRFVDENSLHKRINEHLSLFVVLFAEIQSLRKRVKDKEKEVNEVRRSSLATHIVNHQS